MSYANEFQVSYLFQQSGDMGSWGKIQTLAVVMPIIVNELRKFNAWRAVKYPEPYLKFYEVLSSDINMLLQYELTEDEIQNLEKKLLPETIAFHDGLFLPSNSKICFHQMLCSVPHIRRMGGIRNWWAFGGERSLSTIKRFVPRGGSSMDITVMNRLNSLENYRLSFFNFSLNGDEIIINKRIKKSKLFSATNGNGDLYYKDGNLHFTNRRMYLFKPYKDHTFKTFTPYEINCLLLDLIEVIKIKAKFRNEALRTSALFRMFVKYSRDTKSKDYTFHQWLSQDISKFSIDDRIDWTAVQELCHFFPTTIYSQAYIYGLKWHSRGPTCREELETCSPGFPNNTKNHLRYSWAECSRSESSWYHTHDSFVPVSNNEYVRDGKGRAMLGQFNYFFYINMPSEMHIHGLPFASSTKHSIDTNIPNIFRLVVDKSFIEDDIFQPLCDVTASRLIFYPVDNSRDEHNEKEKPIYLRVPYRNNSRNRSLNHKTIDRHFSKLGPENVLELYFLFLHPYRKRISKKN